MASKNWGRQGRGLPKDAEDRILSDNTLKSKLEAMKMSELRAYVKQHQLKARDTDKSELIDEIIKEVSK